MKRALLSIVSGITLLLSADTLAADSLEAGMTELAAQIVERSAANDVQTIAVVPFQQTDGTCNELGTYLVDELVLNLFSGGAELRIVERSQLQQVLQEIGLSSTGLIDADAIRELGKLQSVDAVILGSIASVGDTIRINARLVETETGQVFSAAATTIPRTDDVQSLISTIRPCSIITDQIDTGNEPSEDPTADAEGQTQLPFTVSASTYELGAIPLEYSETVSVRTGEQGKFFAGQDENGSLEIDYLEISGDYDIVLIADLYNDGSRDIIQELWLTFGDNVYKTMFGLSNRGSDLEFAGRQEDVRNISWNRGNENNGINEITYQVRGRQLRMMINGEPFNSTLIEQEAELTIISLRGIAQNERIFSIEIKRR